MGKMIGNFCLYLLFLFIFQAISPQLSNGTPSLTVVNPKEGVEWVKGSNYVIKWSWSDYNGNIRIQVYRNGVFAATVADSEPVTNGNIGVAFNAPSDWLNSSNYEVRISTSGDQASVTSVCFSITAPEMNSKETVFSKVKKKNQNQTLAYPANAISSKPQAPIGLKIVD